MIETILSCRIGQFTVNTGVNTVDVVAATGVVRPLIDPDGRARFQAKDNILIKSIALTLPYSFCLGNTRISMQLGFKDIINNANYYMQELGYLGRIWIYSENIEVDLNTLWPWNSATLAANTETYLTASIPLQVDNDDTIPAGTKPNISMQNVPAALQWCLLPVFCFVKVIHTLPIGGAP